LRASRLLDDRHGKPSAPLREDAAPTRTYRTRGLLVSEPVAASCSAGSAHPSRRSPPDVAASGATAFRSSRWAGNPAQDLGLGECPTKIGSYRDELQSGRSIPEWQSRTQCRIPEGSALKPAGPGSTTPTVRTRERSTLESHGPTWGCEIQQAGRKTLGATVPQATRRDPKVTVSEAGNPRKHSEKVRALPGSDGALRWSRLRRSRRSRRHGT
jgi:hypothetical protein